MATCSAGGEGNRAFYPGRGSLTELLAKITNTQPVELHTSVRVLGSREDLATNKHLQAQEGEGCFLHLPPRTGDSGLVERQLQSTQNTSPVLCTHTKHTALQGVDHHYPGGHQSQAPSSLHKSHSVHV